MVDRRSLLALLNRRINRLLTVAEAALPPEQFRAFRKIALDEFGWQGLASELEALWRDGR